MAERNGNRKSREQIFRQRTPELGYYLIVTDTQQTEENYLLGLRKAIPQPLQKKLIIKVCKTQTEDLITEALRQARQHQNSELWIVFDRDRVTNFDAIIAAAEANDIRVGWSNPCIEIWFYAYFGAMPTYQDSVSCCRGFSNKFFQTTGQEYEKSYVDIYSRLCRFGDEKKAFRIARQKMIEAQKNSGNEPSKMCPATMLHILIEEIKSKIN